MTIVAPRFSERVPTRLGVGEVLYLVAAPVIAVWVLGISLVDQQGYIDPEFYTGYGQSFPRMWQVFGLTYYAARFPILWLNTVSQALVPGFGGYLLVRILVFAVSALPLYLLARRSYGSATAVVAYAFLFLNPLFPRVLCWDLTTFLSIPMGLAGISLWLLSRRPLSWTTFAAGFVFGVSVNSHVFTGTAIGMFLGVEFLFGLCKKGGLKTFAAMCAVALAGALTCFGLGLLFYVTTVGYVSPARLWQITFIAVAAGQRYADTHYVALADYYATNYEIYVPILMAGALLAVNRRGLFQDTLEARITWFMLAYLAAYCTAVFLLHMNIVQYFWYFGHLTIAVYLAVPVMVGLVVRRVGVAAAAWFGGALALVALAVAIRLDIATGLAKLASGDGRVAIAILAAGVCAIGLLVMRPHRITTMAGLVILALALQTTFLSKSHLGVFERKANVIERPLFDAVLGFHAILNRYDGPKHRVRAWYPTQNPTLQSLASSNLLYTLQDPWTGPGLPAFGESELALIREPDTEYVLLFSVDAGQVEEGLRAISAAGVTVLEVSHLEWGHVPVALKGMLVRLAR